MAKEKTKKVELVAKNGTKASDILCSICSTTVTTLETPTP